MPPPPILPATVLFNSHRHEPKDVDSGNRSCSSSCSRKQTSPLSHQQPKSPFAEANYLLSPKASPAPRCLITTSFLSPSFCLPNENREWEQHGSCMPENVFTSQNLSPHVHLQVPTNPGLSVLRPSMGGASTSQSERGRDMCGLPIQSAIWNSVRRTRIGWRTASALILGQGAATVPILNHFTHYGSLPLLDDSQNMFSCGLGCYATGKY
ncbi:hypothetical protein NDU88_006671 [Pleurodeles waltl]|uniref:Uncharacterized protein n=1 Tax=Pleurodeles waltl TaxID=8319 RepID=A0AAV7PJ19_PLEWA|nr:hypothetical protein NDU88_006671 [Pleurodeles waltl]